MRTLSRMVLYYQEGTKGVSIHDLMSRAKRSTLPPTFRYRKYRDLLRTENNPLFFFDEPPKSQNLKKNAFDGYLRTKAHAKSIKLLAPIPVPVPQQESFFVPTFDREGYDVEMEVDGEVIDLTKELDIKQRFYVPNYSNTRYNADALLFLGAAAEVYRREGQMEETQKILDLVEELRKENNESFYGNGSIEGQLSRHATVVGVYQRVERIRGDFAPSGAETAAFIAYLKQALPIAKKPEFLEYAFGIPSLDLFNVLHHPNNKVAGISPLHIEMNSQAGIIWDTKTKRRDVVFQDLFMANQVMELIWSESLRLSSVLNRKGRSPDEITDEIQTVLRSKLFYANLQYLKPKADPYLRSDFKNKTRNIAVTNSFMGIVPNMFYRPPMAYADPPRFPLLGETPRTLLKWSMFRGGLNELIYHAMGLEDGVVKFVVFADNLYILSNRYILSFDGVKFEAQVEEQDAQDLITALEEAYWGDDIHPAYMAWMRDVYATHCTNGFSMIGSFMLHIPYLSSGQQGTGYLNSTCMLRLLFKAEDMIRKEFLKYQEAGDFEDGKRMLDVCEKNGFLLTLENVLDLEKLKVAEHGDILPGDILGYDVGVFEIREVSKYLAEELEKALDGSHEEDDEVSILHYYDDEKDVLRFYSPVLQRKRLLRSYLFLKSGDSKDEPEGLKAFKKFVTYRTLYTIGGWFHPAADALGLLNLTAFDQVHDVSRDTEFEVQLSIWMESLTDAYISKDVVLAEIMGAERASPSMFEILSLNMGTQVASLWLAHASRSMEKEEFRERLLDLVPTEYVPKILGIEEFVSAQQIHDIAAEALHGSEPTSLNEVNALLSEIMESVNLPAPEQADLAPRKKKATRQGASLKGERPTVQEWGADKPKAPKPPQRPKPIGSPTVRIHDTPTGSTSASDWVKMGDEMKTVQINKALKQLRDPASPFFFDTRKKDTIEVVLKTQDRRIDNPNTLAMNVYMGRLAQRMGVNKHAVKDAFARLGILPFRFALRITAEKV